MTKQPKRPYLIRAMYQWMIDNGETPHIVVDCTYENVLVPQEHVRDNKMVLNISPTAAHELDIANDAMSLTARFNGVPFDVWVPIGSILGIYARETGAGMIFAPEDYDEPDNEPTPPEPEPETKRPHLRVVK